MSLPSSKSRFNDRKAGKEPQKTTLKSSGYVNSGKKPVSGNSSLLGKYHAPGTSLAPSSDEVDDLTSTLLETGLENDPVSDKDSWSVKSEDSKDKISLQDTLDEEEMPWTEIEKKERSRQKNEKKHQRQKEKRAQELYERCCSLLMSKKLKTLTETLEAMGFPSERATRSLIVTKGKIEQSIAWLLETAEGSDQQSKLGNVIPKIDISEELAKMAEMASKNSCSKQDMEKAVIACDGDLEKVAEAFMLQKPFPVPPLKAEETSARAQNSMTPLKSKETVAQVQNPIVAKPKHNRVEEKVVSSHAKAVPVSNVTGPKLEWASKPQTQSGSIKKTDVKNLQFGSMIEPVVAMQPPQSSNLDHEPIVVTQGPQSGNAVQLGSGNLVHGPPGWNFNTYANSFIQVPDHNTNANNFIQVPDHNTNANNFIQVPDHNTYANSFIQVPDHHTNANSFIQVPDHNTYANSFIQVPGHNTNANSFIQVPDQDSNDNSFIQVQDQQHQLFDDVFNYSHVGSPLSVAASLGLFSGLGHPNGFKLRPSPTDWNVWARNITGAMLGSGDYTRVDWTVNRGGASGMGAGMSQNDYDQLLGYDPQAGMMGMMEGKDQLLGYDPQAGMMSMMGMMEGKDQLLGYDPQGYDPQAGMMGMMGMMEGKDQLLGYDPQAGMMGMMGMMGASGGGHFGQVVNSGKEAFSAADVFLEWSSPFEGKDLFSDTRQYVMSPSL